MTAAVIVSNNQFVQYPNQHSGVSTPPPPTPPPVSSKTYDDFTKASGGQNALQAAISGVQQQIGSTVSHLHSAYDTDAATYKQDLQSLESVAGLTGLTGQGVWAAAQLSSFTSTFKEPLFVGSSVSSTSLGGTIGGEGFPGGDQGAIYFGPDKLPSGYIAPPSLPANADEAAISTACDGLTSAQAAYAGWTLAQSESQQQSIGADHIEHRADLRSSVAGVDLLRHLGDPARHFERLGSPRAFCARHGRSSRRVVV